MGGMALMFAQMARDQHAATKRAETGVEITALSSRIVNVLHDSQSCKNTVDSANPGPITGSASFHVDTMRGKGSAWASSRVLLEKGKIYGNRLVKINFMWVEVDSVTNSEADAKFGVIFERVSRAFKGEKTVTGIFPLVLYLDSYGNILGCRSKYDDMTLNIKQEICQEIGGVWDSGTGQCSDIVTTLAEKITELENSKEDKEDTNVCGSVEEKTCEEMTEISKTFSCMGSTFQKYRDCGAGESGCHPVGHKTGEGVGGVYCLTEECLEYPSTCP